VSGVPLFVISKEGDKHAVKLSGAQDPDVFIELFGDLLKLE